jgi:hypothetical protein
MVEADVLERVGDALDEVVLLDECHVSLLHRRSKISDAKV